MIHHRPSRPPPTIDAIAPQGEVVVSLAGDLDLATRASLVELIASSDALERTDLVVDLSEVTFLDGASAQLLFRAAKSLAERACSLTVRSPQPIVHRALLLCGAADTELRISTPGPRSLALHP